MRSHLPSVLGLLLLWICSPCLTAAQSSGPKSRESNSPLPQEAVSQGKPLVHSKASEQTKRLFLIDAEGRPKLFALPGRFDVTVNVRPFEVAPESAHILVWQAPPDLDQAMILEIPKDFSTNMPIIKGLPPFSRDFRGVLTNQPPWFANPFVFSLKPKQPK